MRISRLLAAVVLTGACQETASPRLPVAVVPSTLQLRVSDTSRIATSDARVRVMWRSAVPAVATVDAGGLVTGVTPGVAAIWALGGADSAAASVTVIPVICTIAASISPPNATLAVGDTLRVATRLSFGCSEFTGTVEWIVGDASIATVTPRGTEGEKAFGLITALRAGSVVVTARSIDDPTISVAMALVVKSP